MPPPVGTFQSLPVSQIFFKKNDFNDREQQQAIPPNFISQPAPEEIGINLSPHYNSNAIDGDAPPVLSFRHEAEPHRTKEWNFDLGAHTQRDGGVSPQIPNNSSN